MTNSPPASGQALVPLREGMFKPPSTLGEPARLLANRCRACGETFFPRRVFCAACTSGDMEDVLLGSTGTVQTFTIVRQQPPGSAMTPPYAIVNVAVDRGPTVQTVTPGAHLDGLAIGGRVELIIDKIMDDEAGNAVVSFIARPIPSERPGA
ncbi:MAG: hypothetical protein Kow0010_23910 [Dehalococcoidia bacterium]